MKKIAAALCLLLLLAAGDMAVARPAGGDTEVRLLACHGYGCNFRTMIPLTQQDLQAIRRAFAEYGKTAQGEREAVKKAVAIYEERTTQVIGVRDEPRMAFGRPKRKGQMDCTDESTNTQGVLRYLQGAGYLKFHRSGRPVVRGVFIDGRYPHWTAVMIDDKGGRWAVDSWYGAGGAEPDILPLKEWKKRGRGGRR
ncbi:MAG: Hypothetical protein BHV28_05850 [Candidatus Tokpelaia hoelldobleri]|uniref:Uncharacterized protein n=1 Tax=Candidatus Tokpelaia hoelldobleri TaxID=1902579 RepID=A0A1U9JTV2_9HYPH|nr:MAG: Hypothetical protein BHV28_05850 [Candidatus Tokpelaia hoelldoblerii]